MKQSIQWSISLLNTESVLIMLGIRLYETFNKAKDFFVKPTIYCSFGKWRNNHLLPVWRRGPIIKLGKSPYALPIKGHPTLQPIDIAISTSGISAISLLY